MSGNSFLTLAITTFTVIFMFWICSNAPSRLKYELIQRIYCIPKLYCLPVNNNNPCRILESTLCQDRLKFELNHLECKEETLQVLVGWTPSKSLQKSRNIQNRAALILIKAGKYDHTTLILHSLHWLPVSYRIDYKISLLATTHQCIHGLILTMKVALQINVLLLLLLLLLKVL